MKYVEVIVSLCMLALVFVVAVSFLSGITDTAMKTSVLRNRMYDERQELITGGGL